MNVPSPSPLVPPLNVAYNNANADNCHGPWTVTDLKLENVRSIILKSTLPTDYEIPASTKDQYIIDTYAWVKQNYDYNKTLHHLALLVAIVAASFLPYLFIPTDLKHLFTNAHTNADVRKVYEQMDWIDKPKQNGMVKRGIFVAMFTTYIIAIYSILRGERFFHGVQAKLSFGGIHPSHLLHPKRPLQDRYEDITRRWWMH